MTAYSSDEYSNYRLNRAIETISEVETHIKNGFWNTAVNRMYYACFYAVGALLAKSGVEASSHSGTRLQFGQLFIKTGLFSREMSKIYSDLFEKRHKGDYNDFFDYDQETVERLFPKAELFVKAIDEYIRNS